MPRIPSTRIDPIVTAAHIVTALQSVVSRNVGGADAGVVTVGHISGGQAHNVIPQSVRLLGTARWFAPEVGDILESGVRRVTAGIAAGFGATAELRYERTYIATVNDEAATARTVRAAASVAGEARVEPMEKPTLGGEDFAFMLAAKQGSYIMIGGGRSDADPMVHHPRYDFNDDILPIGASYWATLAEQTLNGA